MQMKVKLECFLQEVSERTTENNQYPVLTSSKAGLYLQSDYFNKQVASKDNTGYKIIKKGQFTYRAMSDTGEFFPNMLECADIGIVSPAYPVFEIVKPIIIPEFLKYYFKSNKFQQSIALFAQGSTRTSIKYEKLKKVLMELPDLNEQQRCVEILDAVQKNIDDRKNELEKLDDLIQARFVEMFGDPQSNPLGFSKKMLKKTCKVVTGNTPSRSVTEYYGDFVEWIKTDNIVSGLLNPTKANESLSEEGMKVGRAVEKDSILMVCIAGSIASIGRVCVTDRTVAFNQQINAVVPEDYNTLFLYVMLQLSKEYLCEEINMALKGILSKSKLEEKEFIVPPIELQTQFATFVQAIDKYKLKVEDSLKKLEILQKSLMQQYFG